MKVKKLEKWDFKRNSEDLPSTRCGTECCHAGTRYHTVINQFILIISSIKLKQIMKLETKGPISANIIFFLKLMFSFFDRTAYAQHPTFHLFIQLHIYSYHFSLNLSTSQISIQLFLIFFSASTQYFPFFTN